MKPIIVGLNNPHSEKPKDALVPWPAGCTGDQIVRMAALADRYFDSDEYLESFVRLNLWGGRELPTGRGSTDLLRRDGQQIVRDYLKERRDAILLGSKVWHCVTNLTPPSFFESRQLGDATCWYLPHPSGINRIYNDESNRRKAGEIIVQVARAAEVTT